MKRNSMAQWINLHRNNIFVNRSYGRQAVRRNKGRFEKFWNPLLIALLGILRRFTKVQCYCSVTNAFQSFFWVKHIVRHVMEARKSGMPCFSCLSLLLSTTVLNDDYAIF